MNDIIELLLTDCTQYINALKSCDRYRVLVRGSEDPVGMIKEYQHNLEFRKPKNMPISIHNQINEEFEPMFGWKIRNGVFCFGYDLKMNMNRNIGYGFNYLLFPKGEFEFVYSTDFFDLVAHLYPFDYVSLKDLVFLSNDLNDALKESKVEKNFSNEISLKTSEYYLVNPELKDEIIKLIWGNDN
jgi:hypothetical protein